MTMTNVLLDTSFCIRLLKENDPFHQHAKDYFRYFLEKRVEIYLSTIVIAEYSVKDDPMNLPLSKMKIIPFDFRDAKVSGEFYALIMNNRPSDIERNVVKDDCKLLAQAYNRNINSYISKDRKSFDQIFAPIQREKKFYMQLIDLSMPIKESIWQLFPPYS